MVLVPYQNSVSNRRGSTCFVLTLSRDLSFDQTVKKEKDLMSFKLITLKKIKNFRKKRKNLTARSLLRNVDRYTSTKCTSQSTLGGSSIFLIFENQPDKMLNPSTSNRSSLFIGFQIVHNPNVELGSFINYTLIITL